MDMIGDTSEALRAYLSMKRQPHDDGVSYLTVFGALQVLYVQQDAMHELCDCLGYPRDVATTETVDAWLKLPDFPALRDVCDLRKMSIGHPVRFTQGKGQPAASAFIVRMSLSADGFEITALDHTGKLLAKQRRANIPALVHTQLKVLEAVLTRAIDEANADEGKHRDTFKGELLEQVFAGLGHPLEKLHDAVSDEDFRPIGMYGVTSVRDAMRDFKMKLHQRNEPFRDDLKHIYRQLDATLTRLTAFYERTADDHELADILATFVSDRVDELREWAREMDQRYASADGE